MPPTVRAETPAIAAMRSVGMCCDLNWSAQHLVKFLRRCHPVQGLSRSPVELGGDLIELFLGEGGDAGALREVLAQQPVGVLVGAALPGTLGVAEVDLHAGV